MPETPKRAEGIKPQDYPQGWHLTACTCLLHPDCTDAMHFLGEQAVSAGPDVGPLGSPHPPTTSGRWLKVLLAEGGGTVFDKGPDRKYFRLAAVNHSALPSRAEAPRATHP